MRPAAAGQARALAAGAASAREDLLGAPGAVAVEPAAVGYGATSRLPGVLRERIAAGQARRMALPGHPRAIVVFDAAQYPLARALLAEHPEAELWYGGSGGGDLHEAALARAALRFGGDADGAPRASATARCGSGWRRWASRAGGSAPSARRSPASGSSAPGRAAGRRCCA